MRWMTINLTVAVLLVHMVIGCCWHHTHSCGEACPEATSVSEESCRGHLHQGDRPADGCSLPAEQRGHLSHRSPHSGQHACEGTICVFLPPNCRLQFSPPDWKGGWESASAPLALDLPQAKRFFLQTHTEPPAARLPLRAHLLNQVLLI